jgi:hypothetical protein
LCGTVTRNGGGSLTGNGGSGTTGGGNNGVDILIPSPKDPRGQAIFLVKIVIVGAGDHKLVDKLPLKTPAGADFPYAMNQTYTDKSSMIYVWLPAGTVIYPPTVAGRLYSGTPYTVTDQSGQICYFGTIYKVTVTKVTGGSGKTTHTEAQYGTKVTLTATAAKGYHFVKWTVTPQAPAPAAGAAGAAGADAVLSKATSSTKEKFEFTMPAADVVATPQFEKDSKPIKPPPAGDNSSLVLWMGALALCTGLLITTTTQGTRIAPASTAAGDTSSQETSTSTRSKKTTRGV